MKENEIRPDEYMPLLEEACEADISILLADKDNWVRVRCPACDGDNFEPLGEKKSVDYVLCRACRTVAVNPRPSEDLLHKMYANSKVYELWNTKIFPASDAKRREGIYRPRADMLIEYCRKCGISEGASFLEVGAGFGSFCDVIRERNYFGSITAVEPTPQMAKACRALGLNVINDFAENAISGNRCDLFCSFEVIEHIYNPFLFLQNACNVLSEHGLIVLSNPNPLGFDAAMLGLKLATFDHEHLNYFNPKSMEILLNRAGFEVIEIVTPGRLDVDIVRKAALDGTLEVSGNPFFEQLLLESSDSVREEFQAFLAKNGLSSHMLSVARKKSS
ncbi:MAG: class I SAM-dependent methyltransferase [Thermoguttaceae bacterium]